SIERRFIRFVALMNKHLEAEGAYYLLALRMAHVPYSIVNPVSGASRIRAWTFLWTTAAGLLPANAIWVYVGVRLPSLSDLASNGAGSFIDLPLLLAMIGCAALPHVVRWFISRFGIPTDDRQNHDVRGNQSEWQ
ncbi:MAG TPA: VTT domain-containing protein, partial [Anaerolineae bacterium]|nr:VTT domain-containing protein [Anaerolineae bacterium]